MESIPAAGFNSADLPRATGTKKAYIIKTHAGNKALDIAGGKANEGSPVIQYNIHGGDNQVWHFEPA